MDAYKLISGSMW